MMGQRTVDLEKMDEQQACQFLTESATVLSPEREYAIHHEDYVMEMPQSGERVQGPENMRAFQEALGSYSSSSPPSIRIRRVLVRDGLWVKDGINDYGEGRIFHSAVIYELRDGKIWRDTRYYGEPFEAPEWRAQWVERVDPEDSYAEPAPAKPTGKNETDGREIRRLIERNWEKVRAGDSSGAHEWYAEDCILEWPQSGERVRGKKNLQALREAYPARVEFEVRRVIGRRDLGVCELVIRYDDSRPVNAIGIFEFGDGKVVRETHYFAEPFEAPEWRAQWVERVGAGR